MATDMDRAYCEWSHDEISDRSNSSETSVSQILDHGSVSFGKYAVESLSWERWSVFSHNRCQDEIEKFRSPGLVAQKKAYFEEYYKKIRTLKALQENQQAAPSLSSASNCSVNSQAGKEEQTSLRPESIRNELADHISTSEEDNNTNSMEEKMVPTDVHHVQHLEIESTACQIDSSGRGSNDKHIEELNLQNNSNKFNHKEITRMDEQPLTETETEVAEPMAIEHEVAAQGTATELTVLSTERHSEKTQAKFPPIDKLKQNVKKCKDKRSLTMTEGSINASVRRNVKLEQTGKADAAKFPQVVKHPARKTDCKTENTASSRQPTATRVSSNSKLTSTSAHGPRTEVQSSVTLPRPISLSAGRRAAAPVSIGDSVSGRAINKTNSIQGTSSRIPAREKSSSVSSHRPFKELRQNVTIPRPFSFSTERKTVAPVSARSGTPEPSNSKTLNKLPKLPVHAKSTSCVQNISVELSGTSGKRSTTLVTRRTHEEFGRSSMVLESHHTIPKERDSEARRRAVMSRSINLPSWSKSNQNGRTDFHLRSNDGGGKWKEGKQETEKRGSKQSLNFNKRGIPNLDHKKVMQSGSMDLMRKGSKLR